MFKITPHIPDFDKTIIEKKRSILVRIPIDREVYYPEMCVRCGGGNPKSKLTVYDSAKFRWWYGYGLLSKKEYIPAHKKCAIITRVLVVAPWVFLLILAFYIINKIPDGYPKDTYLLFIFPIILAFVFWKEYSPQAVAMVIKKGEKEFLFRNKKFGREFIDINKIKE